MFDVVFRALLEKLPGTLYISLGSGPARKDESLENLLIRVDLRAALHKNQ